MNDARRALPAVGSLLDLPGVRALLAQTPRTVVTDAARAVVEQYRRDSSTPAPDDHGWEAAVASEVARRQVASLRPVFNATGVVLHTNLGRAPLASVAVEAIARTASGASNLEYDLDQGTRGSRYVHCAGLLRELTGAEDAVVVNNCAAALVLALQTFADGLEVIVSRGELIEIGGSFRVPEIMGRSGALLREVGTTNRTHADDYRQALGRATGALVKVHRSNFEQRGFVAETSLRELVAIAREAGVPLIFDFGSGLLIPLERFGLTGEPTAREAIADGATLVCMSGDKLLGGPQAGILVGARDAIDACRRNPLTRAFRVDKLTLAALEATLALYRDPERALQDVPALAMITADEDDVRRRVARLVAELAQRGITGDVVATEASVGGGAFPAARIPSWSVALDGDAARLEEKLRQATTPVIGRIAEGKLLLDLRSVLASQDADLALAVAGALASR